MAILQTLTLSVEDLLDHGRRPPPVEVLRPKACPLCGHLAREPGRGLGIVGHGTYTRQVLGLLSAAGEVLVRVRRYLCRGCKKTLSILADSLHPGRWYAAGSILDALRMHLIEGAPERQVREHFGVESDSEVWRSLRRWRRQLLDRLFGWLGRTFGCIGPATTRSEGVARLRRLFAEATASSSPGKPVAASLLGGRVHLRGVCWLLGHDPPGNLISQGPRP